jgi:hypothetical protein
VWALTALALLVLAQTLSLTRMSIIVTGAVLLAVIAWHFVRCIEWGWELPRTSAKVGVLMGVTLIGGVLALQLAAYPTLPGPPQVQVNRPSNNPLDRITFTDDRSDISSIVGSVRSGGRLATYLSAINELRDNPVLGGGLGQLIDVAFAYNSSRAYTVGKQPGVDNAWLTIGLKSGAIGVAAFGALLLLPAIWALRHRDTRLARWFLPALVGIGVLTMTQAFAISSYGPFVLGLLLASPFLAYASTNRRAAAGQL